jgi:Flp pilus assembly protein TadG
MNTLSRWLKSLASREQRKVERQARPPLVAHYWDGGVPQAHPIKDISERGVYLLTEQRWYPGTFVSLSLQRKDVIESDPDRSISVNARVVRSGTDGVGFVFITPEQSNRVGDHTLPPGADKKSFQRFLNRLCADNGQALVEYALCLPLILLLIVNVINFGGFFFAWITVSNAARAGADYAILGASSVGSPPRATAAQVTALIAQDISTLPNNASLVVNICKNSNGTITVLSGTCTSIPADPEPASYVETIIDVTYTYVPFIGSGFRFPGLGIYATIPPTTITRRAVMRSLGG